MLRYLLCSFLLVLLYPTAIDLYLVGLPQISRDLGASESQLHVAFSLYLAGMAATMLIAGKLADTAGRKPVAVAGALIFVVASLLGGAAEQITMFLMARFVQGIGAGFCYVVAFAILRDTLDDARRAKVLSMINGVTCVIPVIAPVVGYLIMLFFPWNTLFVAMAGMGAVVGVVSLVALKETKPQMRTATSSDSLVSPHIEERLWQRFFVSRVVMTSLMCTAILTYVNVSPMLIMTEMGYDRGGYSLVMALTALVSMVTSFSTPIALTYFRERTLLMTSQLLFALSAVTLVTVTILEVSSSWYLLGFGLICAAFSVGFGVAMNQALSPFSFRAGIASSVIGVSQVCLSAAYIWSAGLLGLSAQNILIVSLGLCSVVCAALLFSIPKPARCAPYEEIHYSS
ncbi:MFS transporter [Vibrio furnissii]|uniref:MFS transporter n=1 Tax=Vibrio furnissii TaxID=29494 RepID=UPI000200CAF2|nr:MFS transporter [Vibrio furnissii]ADT86469.1 multidrug resistance protein [Vibrio furnissii NCTC 11218]